MSVSLVAFTDNLHLFQGRRIPRRGEFLLQLSARATFHVPTRFPTEDPQECWTHTKVCRRQAEHVWEHLPGLKMASNGLGARNG